MPLEESLRHRACDRCPIRHGCQYQCTRHRTSTDHGGDHIWRRNCRFQYHCLGRQNPATHDWRYHNGIANRDIRW